MLLLLFFKRSRRIEKLARCCGAANYRPALGRSMWRE
jgi:hypothetical protein